MAAPGCVEQSTHATSHDVPRSSHTECDSLRAQAAADEAHGRKVREDATRVAADRTRAHAMAEVASMGAGRAAEAATSRCRELQAAWDQCSAKGAAINFAVGAATISAAAVQCEEAKSLCDRAASECGRLVDAARALSEWLNELEEGSAQASRSLAEHVLEARVIEEERALISLRRDVAVAQAKLCTEEARVASLRRVVAAKHVSGPHVVASPMVTPDLDDDALLESVQREHRLAVTALADARERATQSEREVSHLLSAREFAHGFLSAQMVELPDRHVALKKSLRRMQGDVAALKASCAEGTRHKAGVETKLRAAKAELQVERTLKSIAVARDNALSETHCHRWGAEAEELSAVAGRCAQLVSADEEHVADNTLALARIALVAVGAAPASRLLVS